MGPKWYNIGRMATKASFFIPANARSENADEYLSPSGKYKLMVTPFQTSPGSWNYSQGIVSNVETGDNLSEIQRNYRSFPFSWIERHPNGHDYLIAGEDYQGSTVVECDTGKRRDHLPAEAQEGLGFCWSAHRFMPEVQILVVNGCHWACPYEFRFYDFADPMSGWAELETGICVDGDARWPVLLPGGILRVYQTEQPTDDSDEDDQGAPLPSVASFTSLRREGQKLIVDGEWISDAEKERRREHAEAHAKHEAELEEFKAGDPLYLAYRELVKDPCLSAESYESYGITYKAWCPDFAGEERRWRRRIIGTSGGGSALTVDLEWATKTGPIKVIVCRDGKHVEDRFFDHSAEAMREAFLFAGGLSS